jgi:hypothetical protein
MSNVDSPLSTGFSDQEGSSDRDRPLTFHWQVPDLARELGLPPALNAAMEATRNAILAEAIIGHEAGQAVSYSRNKNFYRNGIRYRGTAFNYNRVLNTRDQLQDAGLIEDCRVPQGNLGWQSSFFATGKLIDSWPDRVVNSNITKVRSSS